jgi:Fe-S cluster assembly protein SufD
VKEIILKKFGNDDSFSISEDTRFILATEKGGNINLEFLFEKEGVNAEVLIWYKLGGKEKLKLNVVSKHLVSDTGNKVQIRGICEDSAQVVVHGNLCVEKGARKTKASFSHNVLVLGDKVVVETEPSLEIKNNEVQISHGVTQGGVDEASLLYMQSRGLSKKEAEKVFVEGFLGDRFYDIIQQ